jgi:2-dehydropantoate 2-reductase
MKALSQSKPWHILGAGALGCLWAFYGAANNRDFRLIVRNDERLEQFKGLGGVIAVVGDKPVLQPCRALLAEQLETPVEQLLVCCKAQQTVAAMASVAHALTPDSDVVLLQNGMGVAEELQQTEISARLFCAISTDGAHLIDRFTVQRAGYGSTRLGLYPRDPHLTASKHLCRQLALPGLALEACGDIYRTQWHKLTLNAVINPLTAVLNVRNGELLSHPQAAELMPLLCHEIAGISQARGIALTAAELAANIARVCRQTADNISSMLQDIRHQRPTEIAYINGFLQRYADQLRLPTSINPMLIAKVTALEKSFLHSTQGR